MLFPHKLAIYLMKRLAVILWVATMVAGCQSPREAENESKVYLKNTEQFKLQSHEVEGEVNTAQVCLPFQFEKNKTYPVVYLLDANRYMDAVKGISDLLNYRMGEFKSHIQDIIVVGIIYNQSDSAWWVNRSRNDYREHRWKGHQWDHQPIPHSQVQRNWRNWEKNIWNTR